MAFVELALLMRVRSLSQTEARVVLSMEAERVEDVDLQGIADRGNVSAGFARKIAHDLVGKGWLQRVSRGAYLLNPARHGPDAIADTDPFRAGRRIASPYYFGYATAAELLGLLPQASRTYYVVTPSRGRSHVAHAAQFRRVHVAPNRFFGTLTLQRRGEPLVVSDRERTVLDCLDRPELCGGLGGVVRILESAGPHLDWQRLRRYLAKLGSRSLARRLGYLTDQLRPAVRPPGDWVRRASPRPEDPYVPLGRASEYGRRGPRNARWRVIENVPRAVLLAEVDVR